MKVNVVKRSFQNGEVSRDLQGRSNAEFYNSAVERMENFIPHPQGKASFRPSFNHIAENFKDPKQLITFSASDGKGFALALEPGGLIAYNADGRYDIQNSSPQSGARDSVKTGNVWRFEFVGDPGIPNGRIVSSEVTVTDSATLAFATITVQGSVFNSGADFFEVSFEEPDLSFVTDGSTFTFKNLFEIEGATLPDGLEDSFFKHVQVDNTIYVISEGFNASNGIIASLYKIEFDGTSFTGSFVTVTGVLSPTAIGFYEQRLVLGQGNTVFFSKISKTNDYENFTIGNNADDGLRYTIAGSNNNTSDVLWLQATESFLLAGTLSGNFIIRGASQVEPITPNSISIRPIDSLGSAPVNAINSDSRVYFVERESQTLRAMEFTFQIGGHQSLDMSLLAKHIGRNKIQKIVYFQKEPNRIVAVLDNGQLAMLVTDRDQQTQGWCRVVHGNGKIIDAGVSFDGTGGDRLYILVTTEIGLNVTTSIEYLENETFYLDEIDFYTGDAIVDIQSYKDHVKSVQIDDIRLDSKEVFSPVVTFLSINEIQSTAVIRSESGVKEGDIIREESGTGELVVGSVTLGTLNVTINSPFSSTAYNDGIYLTREQNFPRFLEKEIVVSIEGKKQTAQIDQFGFLTDPLTLTKESVYSKEIYGIPYRGLIKTLPLEGVSRLGESDFKKKNLTGLFLKLEHSLGLKYGSNPYDLKDLNLRRVEDSLFEQVPYFSGVTDPLSVQDDWEREKVLYFIQDEPFPMNIISYGYYIGTEEL